MASTTIKIRGIIIKEIPAGETDKILTIFTKDSGKLVVRARGSKNAKSKFITAQLFAYCDFVLYQGNGFFSLTQIALIESFYNLRLEYERLMVAYNIVSVVDKYIPLDPIEEGESQDILLLILKALLRLTKENTDPHFIEVVFGIKFLQLAGFAPNPELVSEELTPVLLYILSQDINTVYNFSVQKNTQTGLERVYQMFLPKLDLE